MKLFSFLLLIFSFGLVGFGLMYPKKPLEHRQKKSVVNKEFNCAQYEEFEFSKRLNNYLGQYIDQSSKEGVPASDDKSGIESFLKLGKLKSVHKNVGFDLENFHYSYAVLTPYAEKILKEIGIAFHDSLSHTPLANTNLLVTSMTRTHATVNRLMRRNRTAVKRSPHLNGNSFDFSFSRFITKEQISDCERQYLQELSASILLHFKKERKIWVTFERNEECLHVVVRKVS